MAGALSLRLLGPFVVGIDGVDVTPSAGKLRSVLAMLAVHHNRPVPVDVLVDELWGDDPPRSAMTTLHTYVYQLRSVLRDAGADVISTHPHAYALHVAPESVDVVQFERGVSLAEQAFTVDGLPAAGRLLADALAVWTGPPLTGVECGARLLAQQAYWIERELAVADRKLEIDLELGNHREVLGELTRLVAGHRLHEGLSRKLMVALHRCGRRGEALDVYRSFRDALVAELGVEPSLPMRDLQRAILNSDEVLDAPANPGPPSGTVVRVVPQPAQLPRAVADFVGREPLLRALEARLIDGGASDGVPIVAFFGPPGVGKSALAVHLAHRIRQRFPDGQIYVDLDEPAHRGDPRSGLDDVLASLGIDVPQVTGRPSGGASVFRSWSADRRVLVVLDNAPDTEAVMPYLPTGDGSAVVVTSRHVLFGLGGARFAEVPPLGHADTVALLSALLGLVCTAGEERDLARIAELCEGLPRLATAVAAYVAGHRGHRLSDVADGLVDNRNTLWRSAATRVADTFGDELAELIIDDMPGDGSGAPAAHSMTSWPAR